MWLGTCPKNITQIEYKRLKNMLAVECRKSATIVFVIKSIQFKMQVSRDYKHHNI